MAITNSACNSADGKTIALEIGDLVEDDGPAAGYSYSPNVDTIIDQTWVKKELDVSTSSARAARLLVGPGGDLHATINGRDIELNAASKLGSKWTAYSIPPDVLKKGVNEIVLHGSGKVWISRAENFAFGSVDRPKHPGRSARSADGGRTWHYDRLGPTGDVAGEYCVRLALDQYRPSGTLTLPVLDAGNLARKVVAMPVTRTGAIRVAVDAETGTAEGVIVRTRCGSTPVPDATHWSEWATGNDIREPKGRFFQIALDLTTNDPLRSPRVKSVRVEVGAVVSAAEWIDRLKVIEICNEEIVKTTIPFEYEPFGRPELKKLRKTHRLDDVVKDATDEFGAITRLSQWSSRQWSQGHLKDFYPPWNALEILKPHLDGTPVGGFCQQYNVVFLQACESFGIPGRAVSIGTGDHNGAIHGGGHEVVELWSNQYRKWVYVDGNTAWYATDDGGAPLSLWELRQRQLRAIRGRPYEPVRIVELQKGGRRWSRLTDWPPFLELRLIPRSNFLEKAAPLPLNQGMLGWMWTGHHAWTDVEYPASLLYGHRVSNRRNWEWTLNQAHFTLEATETPGEVRVHLDTETPSFDCFLAGVDDSDPRPVKSGFVWRLHPGTNKLEVRPRNTAGRVGIASRVVLESP